MCKVQIIADIVERLYVCTWGVSERERGERRQQDSKTERGRGERERERGERRQQDRERER